VALPASIEAGLYLASIVADEGGRRVNRELTPPRYSFIETKVESGSVVLHFPWPTPEWGKTASVDTQNRPVIDT
jgi:hypothetical protein